MEDKKIEGKDYTIEQYGKFKAILHREACHPLKPGMTFYAVPDGILREEDFPEMRRRTRTIDKALLNRTNKEPIFLALTELLLADREIFVSAIDEFFAGKTEVKIDDVFEAYCTGMDRLVKKVGEEAEKQALPQEDVQQMVSGMGFARFFAHGMYF